MNELQQLGIKHGTDKSRHSYANKTYLDIYYPYFENFKSKEIKFLEIGIKDGCSHRLWKEFFKNSIIYGIDIDPRCKQYEEDKIQLFTGSQGDPNLIHEIVSDGKMFDIILDDGSHINELTIKSFELLFPHLKSGGLYIIEDLANSYMEDIANYIKTWPGMEYNNNVNFINKRSDINLLFNKLIENIDMMRLETNIEWVHFYSRIAIIKKI